MISNRRRRNGWNDSRNLWAESGKKDRDHRRGNFGGQITSSPNVENYPGIASVSGSEFSMNLLDQAMKLGTETVVEKVTGIRDEGDIKVIETTGKEYPCRSVILATGVTHRHLGVPGEEKLTGAGVSYCATCDGAFFRGRDVAVIGGGSTALQDAEFLSNYCKKVYLVHRRMSSVERRVLSVAQRKRKCRICPERNSERNPGRYCSRRSEPEQ